MSACAVVAEPQLASPELALVDPALAAELRRELRPSEGVRHLPRARVEEVPVAIEASMLEEPIVPDAPYVEQGAEHFQDDDYALAFVEEAGAQETPAATAASAPSSHYPVLPAPELDDANGTDVALRQIRARLTEEMPACEPKAPPPVHDRVGGKRGLCARDPRTRHSVAGGRLPDPARLLSCPRETPLRSRKAWSHSTRAWVTRTGVSRRVVAYSVRAWISPTRWWLLLACMARVAIARED